MLYAYSLTTIDANTPGIILILMALTVDAMFGNYQEKMMRKYPDFSNADIIFYSYSFGSMMLFVWLIGKFHVRFHAYNTPSV